MPKFVFPSEKNQDDVLQFYNEFAQKGQTCIGYDHFQGYGKDKV